MLGGDSLLYQSRRGGELQIIITRTAQHDIKKPSHKQGQKKKYNNVYGYIVPQEKKNVNRKAIQLF
jgi:hypothetical protein